MIKGRKIIAYLSVIHEGKWDEIVQCIEKKDFPADENEIEKVVSKIKSNYITLLDDNYPETLKRIFKPPLILFYYGDINLLNDFEHTIAIVGSRKPEPYVCEPARNIIKEVSKKLIVVSGLSYGIDSIAHQTCLDVGGKTIGVLGNGIDYIYLESNKELYSNIKEKGLVISEYPGYTEASPANFPFRNRIIAGLAKAIFIPDIKIASGTYSTLSFAISQGKDVYVLPHLPLSNTLNNTLIKEGAVLVDSIEDILGDWS